MYDFLCVFPHANASHSLIHYINQHRRVHLAPYMCLSRSTADIFAYERNLRPWMPVIGACTKDYHLPDVAKQFLDITKRDLVIQTIRDPVESFVAQTNNERFVRCFDALAAAQPIKHEVMEEVIADAVLRYITPAAAEKAFEVETFARHVLIDVEDLKGDKTQGAVENIWRLVGGDPAPENRVSNYFKPIGSRAYVKMRTAGAFLVMVGDLQLRIFPHVEGDLWDWYYDAPNNYYSGREATLWTYPDVNALVPALRLSGALRISVAPMEWYRLHRAVRENIVPEIVTAFEQRMRAINEIFARAEKTMTFTLDSMTPVQTDLLKFGIEEDFRTFLNRHPQEAGRWTVTRNFLGI